jgi:hypothetical protein
LSDYHDYEPQLEFDDSEVIHAAAAVGVDDSFVGKSHEYCSEITYLSALFQRLKMFP